MFVDRDVRNPIASSPVQPFDCGLAFKIRGRLCKSGGVNVLERVYIDHGIQVAANHAGDGGHHTTPATDVKIRGSRCRSDTCSQGCCPEC